MPGAGGRHLPARWRSRKEAVVKPAAVTRAVPVPVEGQPGNDDQADVGNRDGRAFGPRLQESPLTWPQVAQIRDRAQLEPALPGRHHRQDKLLAQPEGSA